jgi:hypothetical protein
MRLGFFILLAVEIVALFLAGVFVDKGSTGSTSEDTLGGVMRFVAIVIISAIVDVFYGVAWLIVRYH